VTGSALGEQGRRLTLAADLTARARRCARAAGDDLPGLARRLEGIAAEVERAHRVRFDPPYPGAGDGVRAVRGGRRLVLACRALTAAGVVEAVVLTTLIEGRPPQVSVAPPRTAPPAGGLQPGARGVPAPPEATDEGGPWRPE
jgi:hypothetical protein